MKLQKNVWKIFRILVIVLAFCACGYFADSAKAAQESTIVVDINSGSVTDAIQDALDTAREIGTAEQPCVVKIPEGTYTITDTLKIYSNTTLEMTGVTLNRGEGVSVMLRTGRKAEADNAEVNGLVGGYQDFVNITLLGGTWDGQYEGDNGMIRMCHGANILLDGVTVRNNMNSHHMEFGAIDGLTVRNCTVYGHKESSGSNTNKEALQLDIMLEDHLGGFYQYDGTPMKNVLIENNNFYDVFRGVGTHSVIMGSYFENIKIINNTFTNIPDVAIAASGYRNCMISGNVMKKVGTGVLFRSLTDNGKQVYELGSNYTVNRDCSSVISGNTIATVKTDKEAAPVGIEVDGFRCSKKTRVIPAGNYYVSNIKVEKNEIVSTGIGIKLDNVRNSLVDGNSITPSSTKLSRRNGITLCNGSNGNTISSNVIKSVTQNGVMLSASSSNVISKNTITSPEECGIKLYQKSTENKINGNKISSSKQHGIYVMGSSTASEINSNQVSKAKQNGIYLRDGVTVSTMKSNKVSSSGKYGIAVYVKSKANNISNNEVAKSKSYGICIDKGCIAKIYTNVFSSNKDGKILVRTDKNYKSDNLKAPKSLTVSSTKTKTAKAAWKTVSGVSGYEIQLSTKKDFSKNKKTVTVKSANTAGKTISGLKKKQVYYVRIRSYSTIGKVTIYSPYSSTQKVSVK